MGKEYTPKTIFHVLENSVIIAQLKLIATYYDHTRGFDIP